MAADGIDTEELLRRVAGGDAEAAGPLLDRHRGSLRRVVARRMDRRVAARMDPSDVVQEAMEIARGGLGTYARERPVPFACWLRRQAIVRLGWLQRFHLRTGKRSVTREAAFDAACRGEGDAALDGLMGSGTSPSGAAVRSEECEMVRAVLGRMEPPDREVLVLRYVARLSLAEIAERLAISPGAVKMRHARAMERFRGLVDRDGAGVRP